MTHQASAFPVTDRAPASDELYEVVNGERKEIPPMGALRGHSPRSCPSTSTFSAGSTNSGSQWLRCCSNS